METVTTRGIGFAGPAAVARTFNLKEALARATLGVVYTTLTKAPHRIENALINAASTDTWKRRTGLTRQTESRISLARRQTSLHPITRIETS